MDRDVATNGPTHHDDGAGDLGSGVGGGASGSGNTAVETSGGGAGGSIMGSSGAIATGGVGGSRNGANTTPATPCGAGSAQEDPTRVPRLPTLPTLFLPHGSPPVPIEPCTSGDWLAAAARSLPCRPSAVVFMSPHTRADVFTVSTDPTPTTLMDFDADTDPTARARLEKLRCVCALSLGRSFAAFGLTYHRAHHSCVLTFDLSKPNHTNDDRIRRRAPQYQTPAQSSDNATYQPNNYPTIQPNNQSLANMIILRN
jgi:hypothetical protein